MTPVTISPKYQVVIPLEVRKNMKLKPGMKMIVTHYQGMIQMIPEEPIENLRGIARGIDTTIIREPDREL